MTQAGVGAAREVVLAIDSGSQSTKVALIDVADGSVVARAHQALRPTVSPEPGQVVYPDDEVWGALSAASRKLLAQNISPVQIVAVGLCATRYCRAHLDASGALVEPMLHWMDSRVRGPVPVDSRIAHVSSSGGYLAWRLTGRFADSYGDYTGFWPLDRSTHAWRTDIDTIALYGMRTDQLPELVPPAGLLGSVTPAASQSTGIPVGTGVYATSNDKAVEALGAGLRHPGQSLISLGTYIAAMTPLGDGGASNDYWVNDAAVAGEYLAESSGVRRGMWTISWFRDLVGLPAGEGEMLLEAEALGVPAGSHGLIAIPDWLATPQTPHRRGALIGFNGSQSRGAIYRALLEGIARRMADHLEAMDGALGRRSDQVILSGGGARSVLMAQVFAALLQRPVRVAGISDAALLGAAVCAAVGVGCYPDADAAVAAMVQQGESIEPHPDQVAAYQRWRLAHRAVDEALDPICRLLSAAESSLDDGDDDEEHARV